LLENRLEDVLNRSASLVVEADGAGVAANRRVVGKAVGLSDCGGALPA
jgi:hypothetical protein